MKKQNGGAGTLLLVLIFAAGIVFLLVYQFYLKKPEKPEVKNIDGVKVEKNISSPTRANEVIQETKDVLKQQQEAMEKRIKDRIPQ
ncbi:MAG TPA: hypothetical protein VM425_19570 [Myxococcota bacterium]|nr:hypothetical protein [Myxococcota bacterium]